MANLEMIISYGLSKLVNWASYIGCVAFSFVSELGCNSWEVLFSM